MKTGRRFHYRPLDIGGTCKGPVSALGRFKAALDDGTVRWVLLADCQQRGGRQTATEQEREEKLRQQVTEEDAAASKVVQHSQPHGWMNRRPADPPEHEQREIEARIAELRQKKIAKAEAGEPEWTMPRSSCRISRTFRNDD